MSGGLLSGTHPFEGHPNVQPTQPETLPHAIVRMRGQGWGDNAIRVQIKNWHPDWTEAKILNSIGAAQPVRTTNPASSGTGALVRKTNGVQSFQNADMPTEDLRTLHRAAVASPLVRTLGEITNPITAVSDAVSAGKRFAQKPGVGTGIGAGVSAAGLLPIGRLGKALKVAKEAEGAAKVGEAAHATEEAGLVREALRGAPKVRAGQAADFSVQRGSRFSKAEAIYRDKSLTPDERQLRASAALRGELDRPTFAGFKKLTPDNVTNLKSQIMTHGTLRTGQKATLLKSLDNAVAGKVPTAGEHKLFEQTFGKETSLGISHAAKTGLWKNVVTNMINVPRTLQSTLDMSGFLRQGAVALGRHPIITGKNFVPLVKSFGSEKYALGVEHEIATRPTFPLMEAGKVALTGSGALQRHEENFTANLLENIGGGKNPIRWSSRSYSAFLNKTRADIFDHLLGVAHDRGENVHDEQFLKDLGELVNVYTGRGGLGSMERGANIFNGLFFSPRLAKSRLDILRQPFNLTLARRNPFVYRQYVRAAAQTFGAMTMILYLAKLNGAQVGLNPRSADFGKIKFGNTRVDLGAGFLQYFHLGGELATGQSKSTISGKVSNIYSGKYGQQTGWDIILNFGVGKLSPPLAIGHDVLAQQTNFGKFNPWQELYQHLTPFTVQDTADVAKTRSKGSLGIAEMAGAGALSTFGGGLQTYGPKKTKPKSTSGGSPGLLSGGGGSSSSSGGGLLSQGG